MHSCECRDCFESTYGLHLCLECAEAGCEVYTPHPLHHARLYDCQREDAYSE